MNGARQVEQLAIDLGHDGVVRQPPADRPGNIERGRALRHFLLAPVG
jgi:hypothetical protein